MLSLPPMHSTHISRIALVGFFSFLGMYLSNLNSAYKNLNTVISWFYYRFCMNEPARIANRFGFCIDFSEFKRFHRSDSVYLIYLPCCMGYKMWPADKASLGLGYLASSTFFFLLIASSSRFFSLLSAHSQMRF